MCSVVLMKPLWSEIYCETRGNAKPSLKTRNGRALLRVKSAVRRNEWTAGVETRSTVWWVSGNKNQNHQPIAQSRPVLIAGRALFFYEMGLSGDRRFAEMRAWMAAMGSAAVTRFMQRKSIGHSRRKQGLHST